MKSATALVHIAFVVPLLHFFWKFLILLVKKKLIAFTKSAEPLLLGEVAALTPEGREFLETRTVNYVRTRAVDAAGCSVFLEQGGVRASHGWS